MKVSTTITVIALATLGFFSCQNQNSNGNYQDTGKALSSQSIPEAQMNYFIVSDSANRMIKSYLTSIGDTNNVVNNNNLQSLILDADALRAYLNDNSIKKVKIMFAHKLDYINEDHFGQPAGYSPNALTIIVAGYDGNGDYVLAPGNMVPDRSIPCPTNCPVTGTAANPLLPVSSN